MSYLKDIVMTAVLGAGLGEVFLRLTAFFHINLPIHSDKRPVFIIGILLFSLAFRALLSIRKGSAEG